MPSEDTQTQAETKPAEASKATVSPVSTETRLTVPSEDTAPFQDTPPSEATVAHGGSNAEEGASSIRDTVPSEATAPYDAAPATAAQRGGLGRIYECRTARDGHSFAEDRLYTALWETGFARLENPETKLITIGWDRMAQLAGMTPRNVRENCFRLIAKLALERVEAHISEQRVGTTYRIYSPQAILRRREAAGLKRVIRNRGGVTFVP